MKKIKLNKEEKELLNSYENENWQSVEKLDAENRRYQECANATFRKDSRVTIAISAKDLEELQKKAIEEGIPYQTLISSVLHKFVSGRLTAKPAKRSSQAKSHPEKAAR